MRINLSGEADQKHTRRKRRGLRPKRKRTRTFDAAIAQPQIQPRRRVRKRRTRTEERRPQRQPRARDERTRAPEASAARRSMNWRLTLVRLPAALLLAGLIALAVYVSADAKFFVYRADIRGVNHLNAKAIYRAARVDEQHIFWIQPQAVAERIAQLDGIAEVRVRCALPARVVIEVREREPVVMWRASSQGHDWWLDEEGVVLPYDGDLDDTIFVVDFSERHLAVGDRVGPRGIVRSVQQLDRALPNVNLFFYDTERGLSFRQDFGELSRAEAGGQQWPVYVGTSEDLTRKIQAMQVLNDYLTRQNLQPTYVDVRWADHPVYHVQGSADAEGGE